MDTLCEIEVACVNLMQYIEYKMEGFYVGEGGRHRPKTCTNKCQTLILGDAEIVKIYKKS